MPLPLIPIAIAAVAILLGAGAAFGIPELLKALEGKKVAILGRQRVGKTTLFEMLRSGRLPEHTAPTVDPKRGGTFHLKIDGHAIEFNVPIQVPGNQDLAFQDWKKAFDRADHVWYLFRSDLISQGDHAEIQLVQSHLDMLKDWRDASPSKPRVLLIGTHGDKDPLYRKESTELRDRVRDADPISVGLVKLKAGVVVGSLKTSDEAKGLVTSIGRHVSR